MVATTAPRARYAPGPCTPAKTRYIDCMNATMTLPDDFAEQVAARAAELVMERLATGSGKSKYVTPAEAASEILKCPRQRVYDLLALGRLTRYKDGGRTLLLRAEVEDYVESTATRARRAA